MKKHFKWAWPEIVQRLLLLVVLFVIAIVGLWLGDDAHGWHIGRALVGTLGAATLLWAADPFLQMVLSDSGEEVPTDGDVA